MTMRAITDRVPGPLLMTLIGLVATGCSSSNDDLADIGGTDGNPGWETGMGTTGDSSGSASDGDTYGSTTGDPSGTSGGTTGGGDSDGLPDTGDEPPPDDNGSTGEPMECDDQNEVSLFLSPDDSNSMSSPVQIRDSVFEGWGIASKPVRVWEFLNYYTFDYPAAVDGELALFTAMTQDEGMQDGEFKLQIAVSSPALTNAARAPMNITLVLDESGSMSGPPMEMLKETCRAIAASLREGDTVSMVTWDTDNAILLGGYSVTGPNDPQLVDIINAMEPGGGTDLNGGLVAGYQLAQQVYDADRINRIVLVSDGGANVGVTDSNIIAENAGSNNEDGIYMVGVGVGLDNTYNDELMDTVTDIGKGASVFITSEAEAWKIFGDNFVNTMAVAARDVQVQLDLPAGYEIVKFSGEEFSENPDEVEPQHIAPNDAMVFHQTIQTCAPELATDDAVATITARYKDALTFEEREISQTVTFAELQAADQQLLRKGAAVFEYATALQAYQNGYDSAQLAPAFQELERAEAALPGDPDLAEIRSVLEALGG